MRTGKQTHTMEEKLDPVATFAALQRKVDDPLADFRGKKLAANARRKPLASAADFALEASAATKRGRDIMAGRNPATERGKKVLAAIKESQSLKSPREQMAAARRGIRSFPPARQV